MKKKGMTACLFLMAAATASAQHAGKIVQRTGITGGLVIQLNSDYVCHRWKDFAYAGTCLTAKI